MEHPHKAIAINQNIGAFIPKTQLVDGKQQPILYSTQAEAQTAADTYAQEMEAKTGIPGWNGFIEGVVPAPETTPEFGPSGGPQGDPTLP